MIPMVDLKGQYNKIKEEVDKAIIDVVESSAYINGPAVQSFSKNLETYLGVKHVIPCANGTDALQVALMALDLQEGDEVISTDFTFAATVEVVKLLKLKVVLVDCYEDDFTINVKAIESAISPRTKAIIPVHLFGQCADMKQIMELSKKHNIPVVEDTAQAIGADYCANGIGGKAGTMGEIGTTSFFPSKNLGCYGDGGAIFTNNDNLATKMRSIVNHGMGKRYYHDQVGVNSRLDSIQAAILDIKLKHLDTYNAARKKAADTYRELLSECELITVPVEREDSTHVYHQYVIQLDDSVNRNAVQQAMLDAGVSAMIYYPIPLHRQKAYQNNEPFNEGDYEVTNRLAEKVLALPIHTELTEEQQKLICETLIKIVRENIR